MKWYSRRFVRRLRRCVRRQVRASLALKRAQRTARRGYNSAHATSGTVLGIGLAVVLCAAAGGGVASRRGEALSAMALLTLAGTGLLMTWPAGALRGLLASAWLGIMLHFPVDETEYVRARVRRFWGISLLTIPPLLAVFIAAAAQSAPFARAVVLGAIFACVEWLALVSLSLFLTHVRRVVRLQQYGWLLVFATMVFTGMFAENAWHLARLIPEKALLISPAGWIPWAFLHLVVEGNADGYGALVPALVLAGLAPVAVRRVHRAFHDAGIEVRGRPTAEALLEVSQLITASREAGMDLTFGGSFAGHAPEDSIAAERRAAEANRAVIRARGFLREVNWRAGGAPLVLLARICGARGRAVLPALVGSPPPWRRLFGFELALLAVGVAVGSFHGWPRSLAVLPALLALATVRVGLLREWRGFVPFLHTMPAGTDLATLLPLSFDEMSAVVLKGRLVRSLGLIPLIPYCGWLVARLGGPIGAGSLAAAQITLILLAAQPLCVPLTILQGKGRWGEWRWRVLKVQLGLILLVAAFAACAFAALTCSWNRLYLAAAIGGLLIVPWLAWLLTRRFYNRGDIDLVAGLRR